MVQILKLGLFLLLAQAAFAQVLQVANGGTGATTGTGAYANLGQLPHAQLPTLLSLDIPDNAANTTGTCGGLAGVPDISIASISINGSVSLTGTQGDGTSVQTYSTNAAIGPLCVASDGSATTTSCTNGSTVTLTTTGTSGAATLSSGVLNIPQYTGGSGGVTYTSPSVNFIPTVTSASGAGTVGNSTFSDDTVGQQAAVGDPLNLNGGGSLTAQGTATSGQNYPCNPLTLGLSYYNAGAVADAYTLGCFVNSGATPTTLVTLYGPSTLSPAVASTSVGLLLAQSASLSATSGQNINSPKLKFRGYVYNGTGSQGQDWNLQAFQGTGANPTSIFTFGCTGTTGQCLVSVPGLTATGTSLIESGISTNSDISGELTLSAATTVSYTFANVYLVRPACWAMPQFDPGSGVRVWITYTSVTSMTVTFSSAVTGTVSYGCTGRS